MARRVEEVAPNDSLYNVLRSRFVRPVSIRTTLPAPKCSARRTGGDSSWGTVGSHTAGSSDPVAGRRRCSRDHRSSSIRAPGYRTLELVGLPFDSVIRLDREEAIPREMVRVSGGHRRRHLLPLRANRPPRGRLPDGSLRGDEPGFKRFVNDGGYKRKQLWSTPSI